MGVKGLQWLNANEQQLEKFSGRWIAFLEKKGVISSGGTLEEALRKARPSKASESPYVFKVPSQKDLERFDLSALWDKRLRAR